MKSRTLLLLVVALLWHGHTMAQEVARYEYGLSDLSDEPVIEGTTRLQARLAESGLTTHFDATYVFQSVVEGGFRGPYFDAFSDETENGHTLSGDLRAELDTERAGWWSGGTFRTRIQNRVGRSAVERAGSLAAINNDALFPNVLDKFDQYAFAISEMAYEHQINESVSVFGGLLNTSQGDENTLAGAALSHSHFLNFALLYSVVEDATCAHTALGGGVNLTPRENVSGSFSVYGSSETAGENPFRNWNGTTLSTEWTVTHTLRERPGAQTLGLLYGINVLRTDLFTDPRLVLISVVLGLPIPADRTDTWAVYYNCHQFIQGDEEGGWGVFARWGFADGNPNPVRLNAALGLGGIGLLPGRDRDRWGLGVFLVDMSDADLLKGLHITDEVGGEIYYNIALSPTLSMTPDIQVVDSGLPRAETVWVLGLRANFTF